MSSEHTPTNAVSPSSDVSWLCERLRYAILSRTFLSSWILAMLLWERTSFSSEGRQRKRSLSSCSWLWLSTSCKGHRSQVRGSEFRVHTSVSEGRSWRESSRLVMRLCESVRVCSWCQGWMTTRLFVSRAVAVSLHPSL